MLDSHPQGKGFEGQRHRLAVQHFKDISGRMAGGENERLTRVELILPPANAL